jgi:hypothetical protein
MLHLTHTEYETGRASQKASCVGRSPIAQLNNVHTCRQLYHSPLIPYYHAVAESAPAHLRWVQPSRPPKVYQRDLTLLARIIASRAGARPMNGSGYAFHLNGQRSVTFDDGLRKGLYFAVKHALEAGWKVILFVCPAFVGNSDLMYRHKASLLVSTARARSLTSSDCARASAMLSERGIAGRDVAQQLLNVPYRLRDALDRAADVLGVDVPSYARRVRPYLGIDELRYLAKRGVFLGSHGLDHAPVTGMDVNAMAEIVNDSLERIGAIAPLRARLFSYPFGDAGVPQSFLHALIEGCGLDYSFGTAGWRPERHPRHVQRLRMETPNCASGILLRELTRKLLRRLLGRSAVRRNES